MEVTRQVIHVAFVRRADYSPRTDANERAGALKEEGKTGAQASKLGTQLQHGRCLSTSDISMLLAGLVGCQLRSALWQMLGARLLVLGSAMVEAELERKRKAGVPRVPSKTHWDCPGHLSGVPQVTHQVWFSAFPCMSFS